MVLAEYAATRHGDASASSKEKPRPKPGRGGLTVRAGNTLCGRICYIDLRVPTWAHIVTVFSLAVPLQASESAASQCGIEFAVLDELARAYSSVLVLKGRKAIGVVGVRVYAPAEAAGVCGYRASSPTRAHGCNLWRTPP